MIPVKERGFINHGSRLGSRLADSSGLRGVDLEFRIGTRGYCRIL